jgi:hypothetical protein
MEPTGIEPVTSCLQRRPGAWRVVPVVPGCLILRGIEDTATFVGGGYFPHLLRPCFVPDLPPSGAAAPPQVSAILKGRQLAATITM